MEEKNKTILAYREKTEIKKGGKFLFIAILVVLAIASVVGIFCMNGKMGDKITGSVVVLALWVVIIFCILRSFKKQEKENSYPDEAIYYEDGFFCIAKDEVLKINANDVLDVKAVTNTNYERQVGGMVKVSEDKNGKIVIKTKDKNYKVDNIKEVKKARFDIVTFINDLRTK